MAFPVRNTACEVRVIGRVGNVRDGKAGDKKVRNISVAFQRSWAKKDENGNQTGEFDHQTSWIEFACWDFAADKAAGITSGDVVEVNYSLADLIADVYEKDGVSKASIKCKRANVLLISKKGDGAASNVPDEALAEAPVAEEAI